MVWTGRARGDRERRRRGGRQPADGALGAEARRGCGVPAPRPRRRETPAAADRRAPSTRRRSTDEDSSSTPTRARRTEHDHRDHRGDRAERAAPGANSHRRRTRGSRGGGRGANRRATRSSSARANARARDRSLAGEDQRQLRELRVLGFDRLAGQGRVDDLERRSSRGHQSDASQAFLSFSIVRYSSVPAADSLTPSTRASSALLQAGVELQRDDLALAGGQLGQRLADGGAAQRDLGAVLDRRPTDGVLGLAHQASRPACGAAARRARRCARSRTARRAPRRGGGRRCGAGGRRARTRARSRPRRRRDRPAASSRRRTRRRGSSGRAPRTAPMRSGIRSDPGSVWDSITPSLRTGTSIRHEVDMVIRSCALRWRQRYSRSAVAAAPAVAARALRQPKQPHRGRRSRRRSGAPSARGRCGRRSTSATPASTRTRSGSGARCRRSASRPGCR